eukprot:g553.t1
MPGTAEYHNHHRELTRYIEHAGATHPPPHLSFISRNGRVHPAHQGMRIAGHPKSILVSMENATPAAAFQSSENHSDFILPSCGPIEQILLKVEAKFRYTDGDTTNNTCRLHPSFSMIDRVQIYLNNNASTADIVVDSDEMFLQYCFTDPPREKAENSSEYGFSDEVNGRIRDDDLAAAFTLAKDTDSSFTRTFALKTPLDMCRLATKHLRNDVRVRIYWSGTPPVTISNDNSGAAVNATATLIDAELIVQHSETDSGVDSDLNKLYNSPVGISWGTYATSRSEHVQASGATGSEVTETLPQHTSAGTFASLLFWTDTAASVGVAVGSGSQLRRLTAFPYNVVHTGLDDGSVEIEDNANKNVVRKESFKYHRQESYNHCGFPHGVRSDYTGFVFLPFCYSVNDALAHGIRSGSIAFDDNGRFKLKYNRATAHNSTSTQTLNKISYVYATIRVQNGILSYQRL